MRSSLRFSVRLFSLIATFFACVAPCVAQDEPCGFFPALEGFKLREVKVEPLFGKPPQQVVQPLARHRGEPFTLAKGEKLKDEVKTLLVGEWEEKVAAALGNNLAKSIKVAYHSWCVQRVSETACRTAFPNDNGQCVDVIVKTKVAQIDIIKVGDAMIPILHTSGMSLLPSLPRPILALNPSLSVSRDRAAGTGISLGLTTDLLTSFAPQSAGESDQKLLPAKAQLLLTALGQKAIDERFYEASVGLAWLRPRVTRQVTQFAVEGGFSAKHAPHGAGSLLQNEATLGASATIRTPQRSLNKLSIGGQYRWASNRFFSATKLPNELTAEHGFGLHLITNGWLAQGFARTAVWLDAGFPNQRVGSYRRLAAMFGFEKEIPLTRGDRCRLIAVKRQTETISNCSYPAKNAPAIGLEALLGAGAAWGNVPEYARFYGGNARLDFLTRSLNSQPLRELPMGPILRSAGEQQAGLSAPNAVLRGGKSFWHINLNVSIPIPAFSFPLIPAVVTKPNNPQQPVAACQTDCLSLKQFIKSQAASQESLAGPLLAKQLLSPQQQKALDDEDDPEHDAAVVAVNQLFPQGRKEAEKIWQEIMPPIEYITDRANIFALKPLVMFDAAHVGGLTGVEARTRFALGGGLQFSIVTAKLEVGYIRTLRPRSQDSRGNFVVRLAFQNIF